ncbi:hypothetical protein BDW72DRAFT_206864 [Aspergillus terricola var. indicus]
MANASVPPPPKSPSEWKKYATSELVSAVPLTWDSRKDENNTSIRRDVYVEETEILNPTNPAPLQYIYRDVFAFTKPSLTIAPGDFGMVQIMTRALTADAPLHITVAVNAESAGYELAIFASVLDQPVTVSIPDIGPAPIAQQQQQKSIQLALGPGTKNVGVRLKVHPDKISSKYEQSFAKGEDADLQALLQTQLRIALALSWRELSIALPLCAHVVSATSNPPRRYPQLNVQAVALGQQLAAQTMAGPDSNWLPVLSYERFKGTLKDALTAAAEFEGEYERFQDKGEMIEAQQDAWDAIVAINQAKIWFCDGLEAWERKQKLKFLFGIFNAIIEAIKGIEDAVDAVTKAEEGAPNIEGKKVSSDTLQTLGECMRALETLYPKVEDLAKTIKKIESDPELEIPSLGDTTGSNYGDADAQMILALGCWDNWTSESDQQLEWAMGEEIGGASEYRLALRKHGVNGKVLAQVEAEAIRAGHEYIQAEIAVLQCQQDIAALNDIREKFNGYDEIYEQAKAMFYDQYQSIRTTLALELRNMVWAYKYWALKDSRVKPDSQNSISDYYSQLVTMDLEVEDVESWYQNDFQEYKKTVRSNELPADYGNLTIAGLKGESHTSLVFTNGSHFRLSGLETVLGGVRPLPEYLGPNRVTELKIRITASGTYADIQQGKIFHFTGKKWDVMFSYDVTESGGQGEIHMDSRFPPTDHAEPTPFTTWTIRLLNPEMFDLSELESVDLNWDVYLRPEFGDRLSQWREQK